MAKKYNENGMKFERKFTTEEVEVFDMFKWMKRESILRNPNGEIIHHFKEVEVPETWSQVAVDILASKYFRKAGVPQKDENGEYKRDENGNLILGSETSLKQVVNRIVGTWRFWGEENGYFRSEKDAKIFEDELKYILIDQIAAPNSPQWFNTGLKWAYNITGPSQGHYYVDNDTGELKRSEDAYTRPQPHACFIQSIKDDLVNEGGIMDLWLKEARLFKYGSGTGTNFSTLRGKGEKLSGGGRSSGVMSFLKIGDAAAGAIKSGGTTRRAAKMVILNVDHPEIEDFIKWKAYEEKKARILIEAGYEGGIEGEAYQSVSGQNSNNSVRVTNDFMNKVDSDEDWELKNVIDGKVYKKVKANKIWNDIIEAAWESADPGLQFDTTINEWHTCPNSGRINASNPCSEYMFLDDTACNLASINLVKFYDGKIFDVEKYQHTIRLLTVVLEISVLMAQFPSKEIAYNSYLFRTLGLGYANLGSLLMRMGIPYDSKEAMAITGCLTSILTGYAYRTSSELASFLGPFKEFEKNKNEMLRVIRNHRNATYNNDNYEGLSIKPVGIDKNYAPSYMLDAAKFSWDEALKGGELFGYRNAQVTVLAPTGTIGLLMDCDTTGIEPDFALVKFKKLVGGGYFKIINQSVKYGLKSLGYKDKEIEEIIKYIVGNPSLKDSPYINIESLKEKGFTDEILEKIEKEIKGVFDISFLFTPDFLGKDFVVNKLGIKDEDLKNINVLEYLSFNREEIEKANEYLCGTMTIEGAPYIKEEHLKVFDCANRCGKGNRFIDYKGHINIMASAQSFISGAISKTVNLPNEINKEEIGEVYKYAWKLGTKAISIYRDGSKAFQPLNTKSKTEESKKEKEVVKVVEKKIEKIVYKPIRKKLPDERTSITHKFEIAGHKGYMTVGLFEDGTPGELFIKMAKEGSTLSGVMDAFATSISLNLQYGVPLDILIKKFSHMRFEPAGITRNKEIPIVKSIIDYIFRWLAIKFLDSTKAAEVHNNNLINFMYNNNGKDNNNKHNNSGNDDSEEKDFKKQRENSVLKSFENSDAPMCPDCGGIMVRNGSCYKCLECGSTSGCS